MATKFTMLPPFDQASGNLTGKQLLKYALNDNPAYDSPVGRVNYARNYRTRYVAGIRAATGKGYIQVKKKTAVHLTQRSKLNMALLGATGAMYADIIRNQSSELYQNLYAQWLELQNLGNKKTFRQSVSDAIRSGLLQKLAEIPYSGPRGVVNITNPWNHTGGNSNVTVGTDTLVKFWPELAANPISFTVEGLQGVAHSGDTFNDLTSSNYNVLSLSTVSDVIVGEQTISSAVAFGDTEGDIVNILTNNSSYPSSSDSIAAVNYTLTAAQSNPG